jgi:hypothetical protein
MSTHVDSEPGELTLAFSLSAVERLENPPAVFEDAQTWSQSIGIIDDDTERIERIVAEYGLRQDFDVQRDRWFLLEEISETRSTRRRVYVGATDQDMRVSTLFDWEYVRLTDAAENAGWTLSAPRSTSGIVARLLAPLRALIK